MTWDLAFQLFMAIVLIGLAIIVISACLHIGGKWRADEEYTSAEAQHIAAEAAQMRLANINILERGGLIICTTGEMHLQPDGSQKPYLIIGPVDHAAPIQDKPLSESEAREINALAAAQKLVALSLASKGRMATQLETYEDARMDNNAQSAAIKWMTSQNMVQATNSGVLVSDNYGTLSGLAQALNLMSAMKKMRPAQSVGE